MSGVAILATPRREGSVQRHRAPDPQLPALVRQFDRNVPRGADDDRASVGAGAADDRFQDQKKLLR
jgi:hypothetical protein